MLPPAAPGCQYPYPPPPELEDLAGAVAAAGRICGRRCLRPVLAGGEPGYSFGGSSTFASAAELIAGRALLAVGLIASARPREARLGTILVTASIAWFVLEWNNPGASSGLAV
jgi:hypothetical protein